MVIFGLVVAVVVLSALVLIVGTVAEVVQRERRWTR
jgi:hypothetical protein